MDRYGQTCGGGQRRRKVRQTFFVSLRLHPVVKRTNDHVEGSSQPVRRSGAPSGKGTPGCQLQGGRPSKTSPEGPGRDPSVRGEGRGEWGLSVGVETDETRVPDRTSGDGPREPDTETQSKSVTLCGRPPLPRLLVVSPPRERKDRGTKS